MQNVSERLNKTLINIGFKLGRDRKDVDIFLGKLEKLDKTKRYSLLLSQLFNCNDINNLKSFLLEATFAYAFESENLPLNYEVKQSSDHQSTVDFLRETQDGRKIYLELRVTQQWDKSYEDIENQLNLKNMYSVSLNGTDEQAEIIRPQSNILAKTQDKDGQPIKFFSTKLGTFNIVVAELSEIILGTVDKSDCMLAAYGDPYVEEYERRNIFGLFQEPESNYPANVLSIANRFSHLRQNIHGILFLVKYSILSPLVFDLMYFLIPNIQIVSDSDAVILNKEFKKVLRPWDD